jgi:hypothetical protein
VPVEFKTDQLRQLVLRRGRPAKPLPGPSTATASPARSSPSIPPASSSTPRSPARSPCRGTPSA